jgi:hypothetical protein
MKKLILGLIILSLMIVSVNAASSGFRFTNSTDDVIFTVSPIGAGNFTSTIAENGILLSDIYCALAGCTFEGNIATDTGFNITAGSTGYFVGDGTYLTGVTIPDNSTQITYQNVTTWPVCGVGEHLDSDGSTLTCTTDETGSADFTNVAYVNETNTFELDQIFQGNINLTSGNVVINDTFSVLWDASGSSITSDSDGTVTFKLGA